MNKEMLLTICIPLVGCPVASAYDVPDKPKCVIDQCNKETCSVETPEGWVEIKRLNGYKEGKKIDCPTHLVEPTQEF